MRSGFLNWGVFLICLGAVPLAVRTGVLPASVASDMLRFWPIILIAIGVAILLRFTPFHLAGGLLTAAVFGLLLGALVSGGFRGAMGACTPGAAGGPTTTQSGAFTGPSASLNMDITCGDIEVARTPAGDWSVEIDGDPQTASITADGSSLSLRSASERFMPFGGDAARQWRVILPREPALTANVTLNASTGYLAVGYGPVSSVNVTFNASDVHVDLAETAAVGLPIINATYNATSGRLTLPQSSINGNITLNASSLTICAPTTLGLGIAYQDTLSSHNFAAAGLTGEGRQWRVPDFDSYQQQAVLDVNANVSSITLDRSGDCQ